jgi:hypothetical protein
LTRLRCSLSSFQYTRRHEGARETHSCGLKRSTTHSSAAPKH